MTVRKPGSGAEQRPVPRDMPDQQARPEDDPWDVSTRRAAGEEADQDVVPDTDEAGTGPRVESRPDTAQSEQPTPQEPSD
ncbi:hypothetical protein [Streptomyces sp. NPDC047841]|uniref:hypothetical protein n=1 Tax=Streptomyces sp. NPDC047841 TaxID=3154708 RepID=UPI003455524F